MELVVKRILIALDPSRRGQSALQAAAHLAAGTGAELAGLFVEDINLLRLAKAVGLLVMVKSEHLVRFASFRPPPALA
jgi:K+-sensing histidine kinase KdpD